MNTDVKETQPIKTFIMRFYDGGDPVTIFFRNPREEWVRDRSGVRREVAEKSINPVLFTLKPSINSIFRIGKQYFKVTGPQRSASPEKFKNDFFVQSIDKDTFERLSQEYFKEGNEEMVLDLEKGSLPLREDQLKIVTESEKR